MAASAAPATRNVKVCVRIEEKTWTAEGEAARSEPKRAPTKGGPSSVEPPGERPAEATAPAQGAEANQEAAGSEAAAREGETATAGPVDVAQTPAGGSPVPSDGARRPDGATLVDEAEADFFAVEPVLYLRRLVEYHVTHEPGFEAVPDGCAETIAVELYPVRSGWTVFVRYSGNAREEKVDVVRLDELGTFAERVTTALLRDVPISRTLTRTTVLRADSEIRHRQIRTLTHLLLGMGSSARVGQLPTAPNETDPAEQQLRVETPLTLALGARNKFRAWAIDGSVRLNLGLTERAPVRSAGGGHADYSAGVGLGLGFLAYADPDAVNTLYYGGGGSFEVSRYQTLPVREWGYSSAPEALWGGGLDVNLLVGYEFMRASILHFFVQGTLSVPAYVFESENDHARIHSYIPSATAELGLLF